MIKWMDALKQKKPSLANIDKNWICHIKAISMAVPSCSYLRLNWWTLPYTWYESLTSAQLLSAIAIRHAVYWISSLDSLVLLDCNNKSISSFLCWPMPIDYLNLYLMFVLKNYHQNHPWHLFPIQKVIIHLCICFSHHCPCPFWRRSG